MKDVNIPDHYDINTIVVLYDVYSKDNDGEYIRQYSDVPMGIYFMGKFDGDTVTNSIVKYVSNEDAFGMGTSYGLRICSRFVVTPNNISISETNIEVDNSDIYPAFCQVMTKMSENIDLMNDVISNTLKSQQTVHDILAVFKNNRINTPYIKNIGDKSYWFVNGKLLGESTLVNSENVKAASEFEIESIKSTLINKL